MSSENKSPRACIAIGNKVLDLSQLENSGLLKSEYFNNATLNSFMNSGGRVIFLGENSYN